MAKGTEFGTRLRRLRDAHRLSLNKLGAIAGISGQAIHLLEKGENMPQRETVRRLAEALGVTPEYLASGRDPSSGERQPVDLYLRQTYDLTEEGVAIVTNLVNQMHEENQERRRRAEEERG